MRAFLPGPNLQFQKSDLQKPKSNWSRDLIADQERGLWIGEWDDLKQSWPILKKTRSARTSPVNGGVIGLHLIAKAFVPTSCGIVKQRMAGTRDARQSYRYV